MTKIETIDQLRELAGRGSGLNCFVLLNGGLRSSKYIRHIAGMCPEGTEYYVFNLIDDSEMYLSESDIMNPKVTMIGEAMGKGALIAEDL